MASTAATLLLLLAATGAALGAPRPTLNLLRGNLGGRHSGLLGHIINSTADALLKPLNVLGGGGHGGGGHTGVGGGSGAQDIGHGGGITLPSGQPGGLENIPSSDASTYSPASQGVPISGGYEQTGGGNIFNNGGGNSGGGESVPENQNSYTDSTNSAGQSVPVVGGHTQGGSGNVFTNGIDLSNGAHSGAGGGQTSVTTQNSVDLAIQEIFGNGGGGGSQGGQEEASTPDKNDHASNLAVGGSTTPGSGHEDSTHSSVDLAIQEIFGKPSSTDSPSSAGSNNSVKREEEIIGGSSSSVNSEFSPAQSGEQKQSTSSPVDLAIQEVFGGGH